MKYCGNCGQQMNDNDVFCPNCGTRAGTAPAGPQQTSQGFRAPKPIGNPNPSQPGQAGYSQPAQQTQPAYRQPVQPAYPPQQGQQGGWYVPSPAKKKPGKWLWILLAAIPVLAGLGVGAFFLFRHKEDKAPKAESFFFRQIAFECGQPEEKTAVVAEFAADADVSELQVRAVCEQTGESIPMTDDGQGADPIAGDKVFSGMAAFASEEEQVLTYHLVINGARADPNGKAAEIRFYRESAVEEELWEIERIEDTLDDIAGDFRAEGDPKKDADAYRQTLNAVLDQLDQMVADGRIRSYEVQLPDIIIRMPIGTFVYTLEVSGSGLEAGGSAGAVSEYVIADEAHKTLLLLPYDGDLSSTPFRAGMSAIAGADLNYEQATEFTGDSVNVELMKQLHSYRVIAINTHGGCNDTDGPFFSIGGGSIPAGDYANGRLLRSSRGKILVTAAFFEYYYEDGALDDCLIYLGCCHGADRARLKNTLLRKGASAVLGYTNSVYSSYDGSMFRTLTGALVRQDPAQTGDKTLPVTTALREAKDEHGDKDPTNTEWYYFWNRVKESDRAELMLYNRNGADPFRLVSERSSGTVSGNVLMASDHSTISYARVTIEGENYRISFFTNRLGQYTYSLPSGEYNVTVEAEGYHTLRCKATVLKNHTTYLETLLLIREEENEDTGVAGGTVTSAITGRGLEGVTLTLHPDWDNPEGETLATISTDGSGNYSIELPVGNYTVLAQLDRYVDLVFNIVVQPGSTYNQNASMNLELEGNQYRIVLTWDENPRDVDLHLQGPNSRGGMFHVYYNSMRYNEGDFPVCQLDVDDTTSYGPETVTLTVLNDDTPYYCYLHRYAGSGTLASSGAKLSVYNGSSEVARFSVPSTGGYGDYWNVFAIRDGKLWVNNSITDSPDLSYMD